MRLVLDPSTMTVGDLEDFEDTVGTPLLEVFTRLQVSGLTALPLVELKGLIWIIRRQDDPAYTFGQTRDIKVPEVLAMEFEVTALAPADAA